MEKYNNKYTELLKEFKKKFTKRIQYRPLKQKTHNKIQT